ncbi:MAG TPA: hypothetical protein VFO83_07695, partial [Aggregicoccus sp.]|nr:hypothetical protein [Aggregicoccus sp.]
EGLPGHVYEFSCTAEDFERCDLQWEADFQRSWSPGFLLEVGRTTRVLYDVRPSDGPIRVSVKALPHGAFGRFQYALSERVDDHPNDAADARQVELGTAALMGQLDPGPDTDVFSFAGEAGHLYVIRCQGAFGANTSFSLTAPERTVDARSPREPNRLELLHMADATGRHTFQLGARDTPAAVPYRCSLEDRGADEHGNDVSSATPLASAASMPVQGTLLEGSDEDFFSFQARAGHAYTLRCDPALQGVCGASGIVDARSAALAQPAGVTRDGLLYVRVRTVGAAGPYALTLEDHGPDQGTGAQDAVALQVGAPVTGYLTSTGDEDFFQFQAEAQRIYRVQAGSSSSVEVSRLAAPGLSLTPYAVGVPGGLFKLTHGELALLRVSSSAPSTYALSVEAVGVDDHPDLREEATAQATGLLVEGRLDTATDVDWIAVELEQRPYAVQSTAVDTKLLLLEVDGMTRVPWDATGGTHVPRSAGRHYVRADVFGTFRAPDAYRLELLPR